jgi:hypothetical protein
VSSAASSTTWSTRTCELADGEIRCNINQLFPTILPYSPKDTDFCDMQSLANSETDDSESRLVLSIDIGSWQSAVAVSYCKRGKAVSRRFIYEVNTSVLGACPIVTCVARWPGQNSDIHQEKVPSVLIYNAEGEVCCDFSARSHSFLTACSWLNAAPKRLPAKKSGRPRRMIGPMWRISRCIFILPQS